MFAALLGLTGVILPETLSAVTVVTSTSDSATNQPLIPGTLRHAIHTAPTNDTIVFSGNLTGKTITLKGGQLSVNRTLTIQGLGAKKLTVSGGNSSRVFLVGPQQTPTAEPVRISGLTLTKGTGTGQDQFGSASVNGGAILNAGLLSLTRCTVNSNKAPGNGGGIANFGTLVATECEIAYNKASADGGGVFNIQDMTIQRCAVTSNTASGNGGGIQEGGTAQYINSTIAANTASLDGGGINDAGGATIDFYNCTVSLNSARNGGGLAVPEFGTSTTLRNTIIAGNTASHAGPDVRDLFIDGSSGIPISGGYNLIGSTSGTGPGAFSGTDQLNVNPKLGPLQHNGGPTLTLALQPTSPAIDTGSNANLITSGEYEMTTDQRGTFARVINGGSSLTVDVGAYEYTPARALKFAAIDTISDHCLISTDCKTRAWAASAIRSIENSLTPELWINDTTLSRCGELVFDQEQNAAYQLEKILKYAPSIACADAAALALEDLAAADEQLATAAIFAAEAANGDAKKVKDAKNELLAAQSYLAKGDYKGAIEHFKHAWEKAQEAQGIRPDDNACKILKKRFDDGDDDDDDDDDCD